RRGAHRGGGLAGHRGHPVPAETAGPGFLRGRGRLHEFFAGFSIVGKRLRSPEGPRRRPMMSPLRLKLHWQILIALALAVPAGLLTAPETAFGPVRPYAVYDFLGALFLRALMMLVVPLIVAAMINAVSGFSGGIGRMGARAVSFFAVSGALAVVTGLVLV